MSRSLTRADRVIASIAVGMFAGWVAWMFRFTAMGAPGNGDFDHLWSAAQVMLEGGDPYAAVGPGRAIPWPYPLYYPETTLWIVAPFTVLSALISQPVFVGIQSAALAYVLLRAHRWRLLVFLSGSFYAVSHLGQWSPGLAAAALAPMALGVLFAAKPTIGAAMWAYSLKRRALIAPISLTLLSVILDPSWPVRWLDVSRGGLHPLPVLQVGGPLILLALARWRRPEARLLVALACVPQTIALHEALPLFLVARSGWECAYLTLATWAVALGAPLLKSAHTPPSFTTGGEQFIAEAMAVNGPLFVAVLYLPCVIMVLRRPNAAEEVAPEQRESSGIESFANGGAQQDHAVGRALVLVAIIGLCWSTWWFLRTAPTLP